MIFSMSFVIFTFRTKHLAKKQTNLAKKLKKFAGKSQQQKNSHAGLAGPAFYNS